MAEDIHCHTCHKIQIFLAVGTPYFHTPSLSEDDGIPAIGVHDVTACVIEEFFHFHVCDNNGKYAEKSNGRQAAAANFTLFPEIY
jgi:hypothetical protein